MIIYRIENSRGQGPYSAAVSSWQVRDHCNLDINPGPFHDPMLNAHLATENIRYSDQLSRHYLFGFESPEQLDAWFHPTELLNLALDGFTIVEYDIPAHEVVIGSKQVMIKKDGVIARYHEAKAPEKHSIPFEAVSPWIAKVELPISMQSINVTININCLGELEVQEYESEAA